MGGYPYTERERQAAKAAIDLIEDRLQRRGHCRVDFKVREDGKSVDISFGTVEVENAQTNRDYDRLIEKTPLDIRYAATDKIAA